MANFGSEVLGLVGTVAPTIATALGGPLAGLGVRTICNVLGLPEDSKPDAVSQAVLGATPDQLLALKQADNQLATTLKQLDVDLEKVSNADSADARARQIALRDHTPAVLAGLLTIGFFGQLGLMIYHSMPAENASAVNILLGSLGTAWIASMHYYFGSSASSRGKDQLLFQSTPVPPGGPGQPAGTP